MAAYSDNPLSLKNGATVTEKLYRIRFTTYMTSRTRRMITNNVTGSMKRVYLVPPIVQANVSILLCMHWLAPSPYQATQLKRCECPEVFISKQAR